MQRDGFCLPFQEKAECHKMEPLILVNRGVMVHFILVGALLNSLTPMRSGKEHCSFAEEKPKS